MAGWHFTGLPKKQSEEIKKNFGSSTKGWGSLPVQIILGTTSWKTSIFPDKKSGMYLLPLKAQVRKKENIGKEDTVSFTLEILMSIKPKRTIQPKKSELIRGYTIKYHANGKTVWSKGKVRNGKPEGYWEWYRPDGTLKRSGTFKAGVPAETWTTYDPKGKIYKVTQKK